MKISTLQSLIDRTSNQIAGFELAIQFEKKTRHECLSDFELEQSRFTENWCNQRLPKLRKIQKELKQEIAEEIEARRSILSGIDYEKLAKEF